MALNVSITDLKRGVLVTLIGGALAAGLIVPALPEYANRRKIECFWTTSQGKVKLVKEGTFPYANYKLEFYNKKGEKTSQISSGEVTLNLPEPYGKTEVDLNGMAYEIKMRGKK